MKEDASCTGVWILHAGIDGSGDMMDIVTFGMACAMVIFAGELVLQGKFNKTIQKLLYKQCVHTMSLMNHQIMMQKKINELEDRLNKAENRER